MQLLAYMLHVDNIDIDIVLADDLPLLWADADQLRQVVQYMHRVVFFTGAILSPDARRFLESVGLPRLSKPLIAAEVRRVVQQASRLT